ncbi:MAG: tyrosine-protein phosphatase [Clostridia bacterium]|nr:tyrosine-protein phosphatase [Clostridia bacterium]
MNKQSIGLTGVSNARELGGYKTIDGRIVKSGLLLRTGRLDKATAEDIRRLEVDYKVGVIVDFRMPAEAVHAPDPDISGAERYSISIINEAEMIKQQKQKGIDMAMMYSDPLIFLKMALESKVVHPGMYIDFLKSNAGKAGFARFLRLAIDAPHDRALLWHCTSGKDRTGIAAMLLLEIFGVSKETIMEDFLLTNEFNREKIEKMREFLDEGLEPTEKHLVNDLLVVLDGVNGSYMENALEYMKSEYGSVMGYISSELQLSDADAEILRNKYLV